MLPTIRRWLPGMIASITPYTLRSNIPECVADNTFCGTPVVYVVDGTTGLVEAQTVTAANATTGDMVAGIAVKVDTLVYDESSTWVSAKYINGDPVTILTIGDIAVRTEVATNPGDPVFFRTTAAGGFTVINVFTNVDDAGTFPITNAAFMEKSTEAGVSIINLPGRCYIG